VLRPWYNSAVCTWRYWNLPGPPISDGEVVPRGRLPGVITKIVLVRKLRLQLAATLLSDVGLASLLRYADAPSPARAALSRAPVVPGHPLSSAEATDTRHPRLAQTFRQAPGTLAERIAALQTALTRDMETSGTPAPTARASAGGFQQFHVPVSVDTQLARAPTAAALESATAARAQREATRRDALLSFNRTRHVMGKPALTPAEEEQFMQADQELVNLQAEETRRRKALASLEELAARAGDAQSYVLALVCDRTPKAPNPDPALLMPA